MVGGRGLRICHVGGSQLGIVLPVTEAENSIPPWGRVVIYGCGLVYCFAGVAIVSDTFMASIEAITNRRQQLVDKAGGKRRTQRVWNETVATLSLMALGSSAPEIAISVVDLFKKDFHFGELGPGTIMGSAAFNLLVIVAVCIFVIPLGEGRIIAELPAFYITALFSVFAYLWMAFILAYSSPDRIDLWEALLTLLFLPILIWVSYQFDIGGHQRFLAMCWRQATDNDEGISAPDEMPVLSFEGPELVEVQSSDEKQTMQLKVTCTPPNGEQQLTKCVKCAYRLEGLTAVEGIEFEATLGELEFSPGLIESQTIDVHVNPKRPSAAASEFLVFLENPQNARFDPETDGGDKATILTVRLLARTDGRRPSQTLDSFVRIDSVIRANAEWKDQFRAALLVGGGDEDDEEVSHMDWCIHILTVPWKLIFAFVPPTQYFGGWPCFFFSLGGIGLVTALVSDLAELFGCVLEIPDVVTALTFVALGTSMPDLFASLSAAREDATADASIVNVTGSNSVNVFLGLGLPWTIGALYWTIAGRTPEWERQYASDPRYALDFEGAAFMVASGDVVFMVWVFCVVSLMALLLLKLRRSWLGAELGGPYLAKMTTSGSFIILWLGFVSVASWRALRWTNASFGETLVVLITACSVGACLVGVTMTTMLFFPSQSEVLPLASVVPASHMEQCAERGEERQHPEEGKIDDEPPSFTTPQGSPPNVPAWDLDVPCLIVGARTPTRHSSRKSSRHSSKSKESVSKSTVDLSSKSPVEVLCQGTLGSPHAVDDIEQFAAPASCSWGPHGPQKHV